MAELLIGRVKRMDSLIEGILGYSRIGRIEESHQQIALDVFVLDVIGFLAPPEGVGVMTHTALPSIVVNKIHITQIFQNLIGNAVKFMNTSEEGRVDIRCFDQEEYWQLSIVDNGPGIDKKYHERKYFFFSLAKNAGREKICHRIKFMDKPEGKITIDCNDHAS